MTSIISQDTKPTKLRYLEDFDVHETQATIVTIEQTSGTVDITLDQTSFYPKGGGQASDTGIIEAENGRLNVVASFLDDNGVVHHVGQIKGTFAVGDSVRCLVDVKQRSLNTRLHSAGHLIDMAIGDIQPGWTPTNGAHYPHMSFVEYSGALAPTDKDTFCQQLQDALDKLLTSTTTNTIQFVKKEELASLCNYVPDYIPSNKPIRVVSFGNYSSPCGGTHVSDLATIGSITLRTIRTKKKKVRISYSL